MSVSTCNRTLDPCKRTRDGTSERTVLALGARDSGKSTFLRYCVNRLLNKHERVMFLDCDVGQCEFTVSGLVSLIEVTRPLLGPPHTHLRSPVRAHYVGCEQFNDSPDYYVSCVKNLVEWWRMYHSQCPLVVNTPGWITGLGIECISSVADHVRPTTIVELVHLSESFDPKQDGIASRLNLDVASNVCSVEKNPRKLSERRIQASTKRTLAFVSYFSQSCATFSTIAALLSREAPYSVPLSSVGVEFLGDQQVETADVLRALNGTIVGLCVTQDSENDEPLRHCVGVGLVRSIHAGWRVLYIVTPVPYQTLLSVNTIVRGKIATPPVFMSKVSTLHGSPYVSHETAGRGAKAMKSRGNLKRKRLSS